MKLSILAVMAVCLVATVSGAAVELTNDNFDTVIEGKNAFVKFLAPWCGHCKSMKPAWDQLGGEYAASSSVVIGDADCTVEKELCSRFEVSGYPTIKYFKDGDKDGDKYSGGRDFDSLKSFVTKELEVQCQADGEGCTDKEKTFMAKVKSKSSDWVSSQLKRLNGMKGGKMRADLKQWIIQRINILKQIVTGKDEL